MLTITNALFPLLALITAGFVIRRLEWLNPSFWPAAEKLTYFFLMPATLINSMYGKKIGSTPWVRMLLTVEGGILASALLVTLWWLLKREMGGAAFTTLFQGGVRFNSFVALALAENIYGSDGLFMAAMGGGFMIILINLLTVTVFSLAVGGGRKIDIKRVALDIMRNPLIIGCLIGVGINGAGITLPSAINGTLALAGKAAFPIGLMAVGAACKFSHLGRNSQLLVVSSFVQFICKPVIAWSMARALGLPDMAASVAVLLFSVPTAPSAYILSRQMGGDHDGMALVITAQTCISFLTLPVTILLLLH